MPPLLLCLHGQTAEPESNPGNSQNVAQLRSAGRRLFSRLPDFACTLRIERSGRPNQKAPLLHQDVLKVEVAYLHGKEMFSWPGARRFSENDITQMISGAIGNGDFALHAQTILLSEGSEIRFQGHDTLDGVAALRFSYRMAQDKANYLMRIGEQQAYVGYSGLLWARAGTFDLLRFEMNINEIPSGFPLRSAFKAINYQRQTLESRTYLLPSTAEMRAVESDGSESVSITSVQNCHEYAGQSSIHYEGLDSDEIATVPDASITKDAPGGMNLSLRLKEPVDVQSTAIGDLLPFVVQKAAKFNKEEWLPKGALVEARVHGMGCVRDPVALCSLVIALERYSFPSSSHIVQTGEILAEMERPLPETLMSQTAAVLGPGGRTMARVWMTDVSRLKQGEGALLVPMGHLPSGYPMTWRTLEVSGETKQ